MICIQKRFGQFGLVVAALLSAVALASGPVYARQGSESDNTSHNASAQNSGSGKETAGSSTATQADGASSARSTQAAPDDIKTDENTGDDKGGFASKWSTDGIPESNSESLRKRAQQLVQDKRQADDGSKHTVAEKQKICGQRQARLEADYSMLDDRASKHLANLNSIYTKLQDYQTRTNLNVSNYAVLTANTDAAKLKATAAVSVLGSVSGTIDCTNQDPAAAVATVKSGVGNARQALQNYRATLKTQLLALLQAKSSSENAHSTEDN